MHACIQWLLGRQADLFLNVLFLTRPQTFIVFSTIIYYQLVCCWHRLHAKKKVTYPPHWYWVCYTTLHANVALGSKLFPSGFFPTAWSAPDDRSAFHWAVCPLMHVASETEPLIFAQVLLPPVSEEPQRPLLTLNSSILFCRSTPFGCFLS